MSSAFTESVVEGAALEHLESAGWHFRNSAENAHCEPAAERDDYGQVVLTQRLREALLQQLISGEPRVKEAARGIEETAA